MPKTGEYRIIGGQLLRAGSSVGSNYRAACRARSRAEFFSKISIVVEEGDESAFWLEVLIRSELLNTEETKDLLKEAIEITSIMSKARKNTKK